MTTLVPSEPLTTTDLHRLAYGGGRRELFDGCLVITHEADHWTAEDLADLPADGRKHELLDGQIIVSPAPRPIHQRVAHRLALRLDAALPPGLEVLPAPVDVRIPGGAPTTLQPDLLVVPSLTADTETVSRPVLAVEVLSPNTRLFDLGPKRLAYARCGIPLYLLVDPLLPSVTVLVLEGTDYVQVSYGEGDTVVRIEGPIVLELTAASLVTPAP